MRSSLLVVALMLAAGCGNVLDNQATSPTGTYTLSRVDGATLPVAIATGFTVRGAIELKSNSHYTLTQTDSASGAATVTSGSGTWSVTDNALQLIPDGGGLLLGIVFADTARMDYRGHQNIYLKH